jgi:hypothetical protein
MFFKNIFPLKNQQIYIISKTNKYHQKITISNFLKIVFCILHIKGSKILHLTACTLIVLNQWD